MFAKHSSMCVIVLAIGAELCAVTPVLAQTLDAPAVSTAVPTGNARPLDDATLSNARGGQAIVIGTQALKSAISGNTIAGNYTAGAINLSDNAFSSFSGMGNVAINTGAQANLQSAINITVNLGN